MKKKAYLTIDDSPSQKTRTLVDYLADKNIPALLFVRGALMEQNPSAIEYAIQKGVMIGNHSYAHHAAGDITPQDWADDLELCDHLIEAAYARCGIPRPGKYYRFPYIDRGDGKKLEQLNNETVQENEKTATLQRYLKDQGFAQPFRNMPGAYPSAALDCLYSFTARDWMLNDKHRGTHDIKTRADLLARAATDGTLRSSAHHHVVLLHDQDGMVDDAIALIDYMIEELDFEFQTL